MTESAVSPTEDGVHPDAISGFATKVLRYFQDFIQTDFKRQQAPRRRIVLKNDAGFRMGIPVRKYASLYDALSKLMREPCSTGVKLSVPRGRFKTPLSLVLRELIQAHVQGITPAEIAAVRRETLAFAKNTRSDGAKNIERYSDAVCLKLAEEVSTRIVGPLLSLLEEPFQANSYSALESVFDVEAELADAISARALQNLPSTLHALVISNDYLPLEAVLDEFLADGDLKSTLVSFFDEFSTADLFLELRDLENTLATAEDQSIYLYLGDVRYGTTTFPLFFVPLELTFDPQFSTYVLQSPPHLYINRRAIDWVAQEISTTAGRTFVPPVQERIIYLDPAQRFAEVAQAQMLSMGRAFDVADQLSFLDGRLHKAESSNLRMSTAFYLAVFDRSDESILSDYEALLTQVEEHSKLSQTMFTNIVKGMLLTEPENAVPQIEKQWDETSVSDRLVAASPIPVNEEQRKIQLSLRSPNCRYVIVQGPPGTGKSHTISALAFDAILAGKSILILSDKTEALDVVQDKLAKTLDQVRQGGHDLPNPILRLGKTSSYPKLMASSNLERIKEQDKAQRANAAQLDEETKVVHADLTSKVEKTISAFSSITLAEIKAMHELEFYLDERSPTLSSRLRQVEDLEHFTTLCLRKSEVSVQQLDEVGRYVGGDWRGFDEFLIELRRGSAIKELSSRVYSVEALAMFSCVNPSQAQLLAGFIEEFEQAKWPVVGFLLSGKKVKKISQKVTASIDCLKPFNLHRRLKELKHVVEIVSAVRKVGAEHQLINEEENLYRALARWTEVPPAVTKSLQLVLAYNAVFADAWPDDPKPLRMQQVVELIHPAVEFVALWRKISSALNSAPDFDYVREKSRLESLHAGRMSREIDSKFVEFVGNNRALSRSLGEVIKSKRQFPTEQFEKFSGAFPCIIAGIREYAQYVPLKHESFDIVVIDEASQVSLAQAFPALLRAQRVVVFGDERQFSNVKSQQASRERNATYLTDLESYFRANISNASDRLERLKQFDVKKSVLDFFKLIANAEIMLKKHFRGYQELISFSSEMFYGGQLQAIKVRSKPLSEVIRFEYLSHDGRTEQRRNSNSVEAEFILLELTKQLEQASPKTVGVITPFREQLEYLSRLVMNSPLYDQFHDKLRLKIMTFDTCQGEERELIIYSLVATHGHDALNYVFPASLDQDKDRIEEALKVQRLNVGFSRAQESMLFVLSKPLGEFRGSIGTALRHFDSVLMKRSEPKGGPVESPMEEKVKAWLQLTAFYQNNRDCLELFTAFPIGNYLKQLDPNYKHPAYRADFLLSYFGSVGDVRIIVEYDGFTEHFINRDSVNASNFEHYYKPSDIERQFVIESYGYKFLRINRFNLGNDPVATLSERLYRLVESASTQRPIDSIEKIKAAAQDLSRGDSKGCPKCGQIKPVVEFFDENLADGKGNYGRVCLDCKKVTPRRVDASDLFRKFGNPFLSPRRFP